MKKINRKQVIFDHADDVYSFCKDHLGAGFTRIELLAEHPELDPAMFGAVMRRVRELAKNDGLFCAMAVREPEAERPWLMTPPLYRVTDSAVHAFRAAIKIRRQAHGAKMLQESHDNFMAARDYDGLSPALRKIAMARKKADEAARQLLEANDEMAMAWQEQDAEYRAELRKFMDGNADKK